MKIALIGLGKMGLGFAARLIRAGHTVYGYDNSAATHDAFTHLGGIVTTIAALPTQAEIIILLVPAGKPVANLITLLEKECNEQTSIIDAGNSHFMDSKNHYEFLKKKNIGFLDCGTSGGILGADAGYSLTIGGDRKIFEQCTPVWHALAQKNGYLHVGSAGSGHYVKMVHNGIEYGLLEAYAEGFNLLKQGDYRQLDLAAIAQTWNHGAIIASQILTLSVRAVRMADDPEDTGIVAESGTARWTMENAEQHAVEVPVINESLKIRVASQKGKVSFATRYIARMRNLFGGHKL